MAKGTGWAMAAVMGSMNVARLRGEIVICPICGGPMTVGSMTEQFKCRSESDEDMPEWLRSALREQGYSPWAYYGHDGAIDVLATAANGVVLEPMRDRGRFGGWQWDGVPEGEVTFPKWFPTEARDAYVAERFQQWEAELAEALEEAEELGLELCSSCGHGPYSFTHKTPCEGTHPKTHLENVLYNIDGERKRREKEDVREAQRQADQATLDEALAEKGFFEGRRGKAVIPDDALVLRSSSMGDRSNPSMLIAASSLTVDQLKALVAAAGNSSEVRMHDRFPVVYSPDPGFWIGKGGRVAKALAQALGIRYLKVEKK